MAGKRLYTEADVRALPRGSEIVLGADALATPAALDLAFERGVRVVHAAGETAGARAAPVGSDLRALLAQDGTYVVEVRSGRARVTRLTEAGPVAFPIGGPA
jgi:hypothetical protein